jgi:hypothetical protein
MPKFPYTRRIDAFSKSFIKIKNCPLLTVGLLSYTGIMLKVLSYIDTGAQVCLFDNAYAKPLGIQDYKNTKSAEDILFLTGIGGRQPENKAYFHDLKLVIFKDQTHFKLKDALRIIETKIGFLENPISFAGILGVYGFLDHFSFKANIPEAYFEIEPIF